MQSITIGRWRGVRVFFQEGIRGERLLHLLSEFHRRHLEKLQRLLNLRREREVLPQA